MHNFIRLLRLCRPHAGAMLLGVFLTVLTVLANVGLLAISGWFLASMAAAGLAAVQMNYFTPAGIIRFLAIVRTASRYGERLVTHNATFLLLSEIRVSVFATLSQLNNQQLAMNRSADLFNRMQNDVDALDKFYLNVLLPMLVALVCVPIVIWIIAGFNPQVALVCLGALLLVGVGLPILLSAKLSRTAAQQTERSAQLREALSDMLTGQRELALYQATDSQLAKCNAIQQSYNYLLDKRHGALGDSDGLSLIVVQLAMLGSVCLLVPLVVTQQIANVHLAMLSLFVLASFETVLTLPNAFIQLPVALSAAERIFALKDSLAKSQNTLNSGSNSNIKSNSAKGKIQQEQDRRPQPQPQPNQHENNALSITKGIGLKLQNVCYQYDSDPFTGNLPIKPSPSNQHFALADISLSINPNQNVALVGPSGSGKSTLVNLLSGLWPEQQGSIRITHDAKEQTDSEYAINQLTFAQRTKRIAILAQQHHIFDGTIADNLRYAAPDATHEQMLCACEQAQLGDWVFTLPNKLDTRLGSAGRRISQGQSRRLAIAQMLLRRPALLVLDEPTEGLDNQSKQAVMDAIMHAMSESTVLCVTHDPALLSNMDKVIWLENGQVKGEGSHQELLTKYEQYKALTTRI